MIKDLKKQLLAEKQRSEKLSEKMKEHFDPPSNFSEVSKGEVEPDRTSNSSWSIYSGKILLQIFGKQKFLRLSKEFELSATPVLVTLYQSYKFECFAPCDLKFSTIFKSKQASTMPCRKVAANFKSYLE